MTILEFGCFLEVKYFRLTFIHNDGGVSEEGQFLLRDLDIQWFYTTSKQIIIITQDVLHIELGLCYLVEIFIFLFF